MFVDPEAVKGSYPVPDNRLRTVGFYFDLKTSQKSVVEDWADFDEGNYYNYIVIEEMPERLYPHADKGREWWYNFDGEKWKKCKKPDLLQGICSFGMG